MYFFQHTYIIVILISLLCIYYYLSKYMEKYETYEYKTDDDDPIDYSNPEVIKKELDVDNYDSEKKKVSYTLNTKPANSMRYFLDEHRTEFIEPVPFSPHVILHGTPALTLSKKFIVKDTIDDIDTIDDHIASLNRDDFCIKNKHLPACVAAERSFKCFGKIEFTEKECTAETDLIGNRVAPGVWDRRCVANQDCPFYKANKNYPNDFGKCVNSVCELPTGVQRIGYRKYDKNTLPLCYNCEDEKTGKKVKGHCCEKQHRPDYVFENDVRQRYIYRKQLSEKGLSTTMNDNYDKEFRLLEKKLKI